MPGSLFMSATGIENSYPNILVPDVPKGWMKWLKPRIIINGKGILIW